MDTPMDLQALIPCTLFHSFWGDRDSRCSRNGNVSNFTFSFVSHVIRCHVKFLRKLLSIFCQELVSMNVKPASFRQVDTKASDPFFEVTAVSQPEAQRKNVCTGCETEACTEEEKCVCLLLNSGVWIWKRCQLQSWDIKLQRKPAWAMNIIEVLEPDLHGQGFVWWSFFFFWREVCLWLEKKPEIPAVKTHKNNKKAV